MARHLEHPSLATRWTGTDFETLPQAIRSDVTVWFGVSEDDGGTWEGLRALRLGNDGAELAAVPVFAYNVNLGDHVTVMASAEGPLVAIATVSPASARTFRVWFREGGAGSGQEAWRQLQVDLAPYGCWIDVYSPRLLAISAELHHASSVSALLAEKERGGLLQYETGQTNDLTGVHAFSDEVHGLSQCDEP